MYPIILHENGTWPNKDNEDEVKRSNEILKQLDDKDRKVIKELNDKNWFEIEELTSGIQIRAKQFVGKHDFVNAGFKLSVIPKIFDMNDENVWKDTIAIIDFANVLTIMCLDNSKIITATISIKTSVKISIL